MRRSALSVLFAVVLFMATAVVAQAGSFHFRSATFLGGSLRFDGTAVGLGSEAYDVTLEGTASVVAMCQNKGGTQAPGRNALSVSVTDSVQVSTEDNGQALVTIVLDDPTMASFGSGSPSNKEAGCPNGKWSVVDVTVQEWTAARLTVVDSTGTTVFDQFFDCSGAGATLQCAPA